jgi:hypothetical protein
VLVRGSDAKPPRGVDQLFGGRSLTKSQSIVARCCINKDSFGLFRISRERGVYTLLLVNVVIYGSGGLLCGPNWAMFAT